MKNVHFLLTKKRRPCWSPHLEALDTQIQFVDIPLLGAINAGVPVDICEQQESVRVPGHMVRKESYALKVKGHSMVEDGIQDGDIIIVKRQTSAQNGQSVVALINGEKTTLKKFYIEKEGIRLQPANATMVPIFLQHHEVEILGIVECVVRLP